MQLAPCWTTSVSSRSAILFLALTRTSLITWEGNSGNDQVKPYNQGKSSTSHSDYILSPMQMCCPANSIGVFTIGIFQ